MRLTSQTRDRARRKRRYLVHLSYALDESSGEYRYTAAIRPWLSRGKLAVKAKHHQFADECDMVDTINPLLPHGSDVRNLLSHIESSEGFLYLLYLDVEEAKRLGWPNDET